MRATRRPVPVAMRVITGTRIPRALYGLLRRPVQRIFIVTPFLEDYEFFGRGPFSSMLMKQLVEGSKITLLTMPPEGTNGTTRAFTRKYRLMQGLATRGVTVLFNRDLHAKVFLFDQSETMKACILGSANLTTAAMNDRLEIAIHTYNRDVFQNVLSVVYKFRDDDRTSSFIRWKHEQRARIRAIVGGS